MIYDAFPFFNELDLLELRLKILDGVVDRWVIVESPVTHSGLAKPLYYRDNWKRYRRWADRITHYVPQDAPLGRDPWEREHWHRDRFADVLKPNADDLITFSDADEIPNPNVYGRFDVTQGYASLDMLMLTYYLNTRKFVRWRYAKICSGSFWNHLPRIKSLRYDVTRWYGADWGVYNSLIPWAGWHFTWLGTRKSRIRKALSTSHHRDRECRVFLKYLDDDPHPGLGHDVHVVPIDSRWPQEIRDNLEHYRRLGWIYETP